MYLWIVALAFIAVLTITAVLLHKRVGGRAIFVAIFLLALGTATLAFGIYSAAVEEQDGAFSAASGAGRVMTFGTACLALGAGNVYRLLKAKKG